MTDFYGPGRGGDQYPDPAGGATWIGGNPGENPSGASGGYPVAAQPPLAGYPSPGSASGPGTPGSDSGGPEAAAAGPYGTAAQYGPYGAGAQGPYPPGYAAPGYAAPGYAAPGYAAPGYAAPGYPGYPYPGAVYAYAAPRPSKPGPLVGAAVMAFITGGLDLMGGIFTLFVNSITPLMSELWWAPWMWVVMLLSLCSGGLLIGGGVTAMRGPTAMLFIGAGITAAIAVYWLAVIGEPSGDYTPFAALRVYPAIYLALCVVMVGLALAPSARGWRPDHPAAR